MGVLYTLPLESSLPAYPAGFTSLAGFVAGEIDQARKDSSRNLLLFGDFDTDGVCSSAILYFMTRLCGVWVTPYQSKRNDGYGLSDKSLKRLIDAVAEPKKTTVILMDLGVSSTAHAEKLLRLGMSVVVIDHHVPAKRAKSQWERLATEHQGRVSVYDPLLSNAPGDESMRALSAAGLVYLMCLLILETNLSGLGEAALSSDRVEIISGSHKVRTSTVIASMGKIAAIAAQADCIPLATVKDGVRTMTRSWYLVKGYETSESLTAGVQSLWNLSQSGSRIAWSVSPLLNAAGRLSDAYAAFQLLIETSEIAAKQMLDTIQGVRTRVRSTVNLAADGLKDALKTLSGVAVLIGDRAQISGGVAGIAAARAADSLSRPAVYLIEETLEDGTTALKGSCRAGGTDFNFDGWIKELHEEGLLLSGGGHAKAAGLSLKTSALAHFLSSAGSQTFNLEERLVHASGIDAAAEYAESVLSVVPFGRGHESERFSVRAVLGGVKKLTTKKFGPERTWAYELYLKDGGSGRPLRTKIMSNEAGDLLGQFLDGSPEQRMRIPVDVVLEVVDNFRAGSNFPRAEIRVATATAGEEDPTESGRVALISFPLPGDGPDLPDEDLSKGLNLYVDSDSRNPGSFILLRTSESGTQALIGERRSEELRGEHGGSYDESRGVYLLPSATVALLKHLNEGGSRYWRYQFSDAAEALIKEGATNLAEVQESKIDSSPFIIPGLDLSYRTPLPFQYADIRFLLSRDLGICQNDMGTGKTLIAACVAATVSEERKLPSLFATPKSVQAQYAGELSKMFPAKTTLTLTTEGINLFLNGAGVKADTGDDEDDEPKKKTKGKKKKKGRGLKPLKSLSKSLIARFKSEILTGAEFVVITYDTAARHPWIVSQLSWAVAALDEAHLLKSHDSHRTKAFFGTAVVPVTDKRSPLCGSKVLALSGTLAANRPGDLFVWVRLTGADGGIYTSGAPGEARTRFEMRFDGMRWERAKAKTRDGRLFDYTKKVYGIPENGEELKRLLAPFTLRREKDEIGDLPEINVTLQRVASTGLYQNIITFIEGGDLSDENAELLTRHGLLSGGQLKSEDGAAGETLAGKLAMVSSLDKAVGTAAVLGELGWLNSEGQFVIVARNICATAEVCSQLKAAGVSFHLLSQADSGEERRIKQEDFQNGGVKAFVTTYGVGGVGLNLTAANRILMIGLPDTATQLAQARDRVHRIGQTRPVECVLLALSASIDERTLFLLRRKGKANAKTYGPDRLTKRGKLPGYCTGNVIDQAGSTDSLVKNLFDLLRA